MSSSPLASVIMLSPNCNRPRNQPIRRITIHHMAGNISVETCGNIFAKEARQASSNYGIGTDGRIALYVDEANRAWTSSSGDNDHQAVTIEVANSQMGGDWPVSDEALSALIRLCADICRRNNIAALEYTGDTTCKTGNMTLHKWFAPTACPGPYLEARMGYIADEVNKLLGGEPATLYRVQAGAFKYLNGAKLYQQTLAQKGFETYLVKAGGLYKVQLGAFLSLQNAQTQRDKLSAAGVVSFITTEPGEPV